MEKKTDRKKGEIDKSTILVGNFNTPLSIIDRTRRQKISQDIEDLGNTTNHIDLVDIYRTFYPTTAECTFSPSAKNIYQDRPYSGP